MKNDMSLCCYVQSGAVVSLIIGRTGTCITISCPGREERSTRYAGNAKSVEVKEV